MSRFSATAPGHDGGAVIEIRAADLLALPVRLRGIQLGRPADLLLDREELKAIGLDVRCGDGIHRFLPLPTASVSPDGIAIRSPLVLLEEDELAFYEARSFALASLRGRSVERGGREVGTLVDVVVGVDCLLRQIVVSGDGGERRLSFDRSIRLTPGSRSAA
jgi:hypothetical protein